jgi:hypothetical protein
MIRYGAGARLARGCATETASSRLEANHRSAAARRTNGVPPKLQASRRRRKPQRDRADVKEGAHGGTRGSPVAQIVLTSAMSRVTESFASPKSITVLGLVKSSLSIPAKPGLMLRLSTTTCEARSTSRIGIP